MSHSPIRNDKTCLNCKHVVERRFCPNCGQENTDTRKTFHHLFIHFFEDLTHYENAFWKTIRNLLFKPAALTREYLSGKRLSYLAPVRLYIFISFITFFLIAVLVKPSDLVEDKEEHEKMLRVLPELRDSLHIADNMLNRIISKEMLTFHEATKFRSALSNSIDDQKPNRFRVVFNIVQQMDTTYIAGGTEAKPVMAFRKTMMDELKRYDRKTIDFGYGSLEELEHRRKFGKGEEQVSDMEYYFVSRIMKIQEKYSGAEIREKFLTSLISNFPKVLFIYMPMFAFFLWLFHDKKRWFYFDHGIFTLHYFSFLILISLISFLAGWILEHLGDNIFTNATDAIISFAASIWMIYYLFPAHHRFYGESRIVSFIKTVSLFGINAVLLFIIMVAYFVYSLINIH